MPDSPLILVVDDDPGIRRVATANLRLSGFEVKVAASGQEALALLDSCDPMAMVSDLKMPGMDGLQLMEEVRKRLPNLPIVVATAHASVETAVQAMQRGALHYLTKPVNFDELALLMQHAVAAERARRDVLSLRGEVERAQGFDDLVGDSPAMRQVQAIVSRVALASATALVRGETGTGKELVARAIHRLSPRKDRPFVAVNCSAIPRELMESEFFGHERGAFTGATGRRIGCFERADGSTLFLDEVGDLDPALQAKLLRVLQERELCRVGSNTPIKVDVRIVAATNRDLEEAVRGGAFREDLYYRLNVIPIELPPLRERTGDVGVLMEHFLAHFARSYGCEVEPMSPEVARTAAAHTWPGNVRELRNVCERAVLLGWPAVVPLLEQAAGTAPCAVDYELPFVEAKRAVMERFERQYVERLLARHGGRMGAAAQAAGMAERNLYEKMKALGLRKEDYR